MGGQYWEFAEIYPAKLSLKLLNLTFYFEYLKAISFISHFFNFENLNISILLNYQIVLIY